MKNYVLEEEAFKFKNEFLEEHEDGIDRFDIEDIFIAGAEWQKEQLIDKACKWLKCKYDDIGLQWMRGVNVSDVIDDFRSELGKI